MGTKINNIRGLVLPDGVMLSKWLAREGITRAEQSAYARRGTIKRVGVGVYKFPESAPTLYGILSSYGNQGEITYHIGASSALEIKGFSHYVTMGRSRIYIYTPKTQRLPKWVVLVLRNEEIVETSTSVFGNIGIENTDYNGYHLNVSSPERAIMECILLSPKYYNLTDVQYLMEMLTNLRSKVVQQLLEGCTSVKVKRMFLYMAKKAKHRWVEKIDLSRINLGSGTRSYSKSGVKDSKFDIVIPKELADYE